MTTAVEEELARSMASARNMYANIREHMEELFESQMYTTFEDHSAPQGKEQSFITANAKKIIIFVVFFMALGCGLWFLAALVPELSKGRNVAGDGKEAAAGV